MQFYKYQSNKFIEKQMQTQNIDCIFSSQNKKRRHTAFINEIWNGIQKHKTRQWRKQKKMNLISFSKSQIKINVDMIYNHKNY